MTNLQFDSTVLHNGMLIPGRRIENNQEVFKGAVVNLESDTRGLKEVAASLIDRGLAHETAEPATHTLTLVNAAQEAMPLDGSGGSAPVADSLRRNLAFQKEVADQKAASVQPDGFPQHQAPAAPAPAPVQPEPQPTPEEIAAAAASQN